MEAPSAVNVCFLSCQSIGKLIAFSKVLHESSAGCLSVFVVSGQLNTHFALPQTLLEQSSACSVSAQAERAAAEEAARVEAASPRTIDSLSPRYSGYILSFLRSGMILAGLAVRLLSEPTRVHIHPDPE